MKKTIGLLFITFMFVTSCQQKQENVLIIAAASNMQFAIKQLAKSFTQQTGIKCNLVLSSSGKITAQITEGAPFDVFVSADMKYPTQLYKKGLTLDKPKIYGYGKLILWTMYPEISPSIETLTNSDIQHIAIANPKTAPYGMAAIEALKEHNIFDAIKEKLVYGENIAQTNQFIVLKSANIGFTSKSVVLSAQMRDKGIWKELDTSSYSTIAQGVALIKQKDRIYDDAQKFHEFLFSKSAKKILKDYGYSTP